jgi:hypothetical protein
MDTTPSFPCTLMYPALFPAFPLNPPKLKVMVTINPDNLTFVSVGPGKTVASEPYGNIQNAVIDHVSPETQMLEIFRKSLVRIIIVAAVFFFYMVYTHLRDPYSPVYYLLIALVGAGVSGALFFTLNGGLTAWHSIIRVVFTPVEHRKKFYFEIKPEDEIAIQEALRTAGINLVGESSKGK